MGVAYILTRKEPERSLETVRPVKSITKVWPKTAMPTARLSIRKTVIPDSFGMLAFTSVITTSIASGKARQKI